MKRILVPGIVGILAVVGVACDDDDGGGGNAQTFCDLNSDLGTGDDATDEQLDELADAAPDEIRDDAGAVIDNVKEEGVGNLPDDLQDESDNVEAWTEDNCDGEE